MSRHCDAIGCTADVAQGLFMCPDHWHSAPANLRATINARYKAGRRNWAFLSDPVYLQAAVDAIDHLAKCDGKAGESSYHRLLRGVEKRSEGGTSNG